MLVAFRYGFCTRVLNWVWCLEKPIFHYKVGLKHGTDLRVRSQIGYRVFGQVINRIGNNRGFWSKIALFSAEAPYRKRRTGDDGKLSSVLRVPHIYQFPFNF